MRSNMPRGGYVGRVGGRCVTALALGLFVVGGAACTVIEGVGIDDPGETPDASPTSTSTTPVPTGTATGTGAPDAGPAPTDAAADATLADADVDAATDASLDGATDGGATPVMPGVDGILRGTVGGLVEHSWVGTIPLPNAGCPASAQTVTMGQISCCRFGGSFPNASRVPVEFDLATGMGTLAGAPIGPFGAVIVEGDGTMRFRQPTILHAQKAWTAGVEMGRHMMAPASEIEEATKLFSLGLVRPVSDSLRNMQVTWNPTTKVFRITMDLTMYQANAAGTCNLPSGNSSGRLFYDLR